MVALDLRNWKRVYSGSPLVWGEKLMHGGIGPGKLWQVTLHRGLQFDGSALGQLDDGQSSERFGDGGDAKWRGWSRGHVWYRDWSRPRNVRAALFPFRVTRTEIPGVFWLRAASLMKSSTRFSKAKPVMGRRKGRSVVKRQSGAGHLEAFLMVPQFFSISQCKNLLWTPHPPPYRLPSHDRFRRTTGLFHH